MLNQCTIMKEEVIFEYNGEFYSSLEASDAEINFELQCFVEESEGEDSSEEINIVIKAQECLITMQKNLIIKNYCLK